MRFTIKVPRVLLDVFLIWQKEKFTEFTAWLLLAKTDNILQLHWSHNSAICLGKLSVNSTKCTKFTNKENLPSHEILVIAEY